MGVLHTGFMSRFSLASDEVDYLAGFVKKGRKSARELTRARILLMLHDGMTEMDIKGTLGICRATVSNIKRRYREDGLQCALSEKPRSGQPKKYTDAQEAEIIALACTSPPKGRVRWTIRLLAEKLNEREGFETINRETVRLVLKKAKLDLG
jgi:transposase